MSACKCHVCGNQLGRSRRSWGWIGAFWFSMDQIYKAHHLCINNRKVRRIPKAWERCLTLEIVAKDPLLG